MRTSHSRTVAPTDVVVDVSTVMLAARVTHTLEDVLVEDWIKAATEWVESYTDRGLLPQTHRYTLSELPTRWWLPMAAPLKTLTSVQYYNASNALTTWSSANYLTPASHQPAMVEVLSTASLPTLYDRSDAVIVTYDVGWDTARDVPAPLVQAVQMLATHWYENREGVLVGTISKEIEFGVTALCAPYRVWRREPAWS